VGINPLHALFPDEPEHASPYTPSSRLQLNPLYLDPVAIPDFQECELARDLVGSDDFGAALAAARRGDLVDYTAAATLKGRVLEELYLWFRRTHLLRDSARADDFRHFQAGGGRRLRDFSAFQALTEFFGHRRWWEWPEAYRDPASEKLAEFSRHHDERLEFSQYLQWQSDAQLAAAHRRAEALGMTPGIYRDLAVGVDPDGVDAWAEQEVITWGSRIGAPPDPFNPMGQEWGLLPLRPRMLRKTGYDYFIAALRANMRSAGALRIDHAMGLRRMFWVPVGEDPVSGAYVRYPHEDLLGILALESHRHRCVVIGEDLGTVPEGFRERMAAAGTLSYRVIYFEKDADRFKRPAEYSGLSLACASTHDLPTLVGFWEERDLTLRKRLGLYASEEAQLEEDRARDRDRRLLLQALAAEDLLPASVDPERPGETAMTRELMHAVHAYLARSPACLLMVQIDDLLGEADQINLPGTVSERPNWRRKLSCELEDVAADATVRALAEALRRARPHGCPAGPAAPAAEGEELSRRASGRPAA
jgi:(1->4)-alpha-D-glucan 1-alpha-D-glucosylmutase